MKTNARVLLLVLALALASAQAAPAQAAPAPGDLPLPRPFVLPLKNANERTAALTSRQDRPHAAVALGILKSLAGRHEEALALLGAPALSAPLASWARAYAGLSLYALGRYDQAVAALDGVDPADPGVGAEALLLSAYSLDAADSPEALARYRRFLDLGDHPYRSVALWRTAELEAAAGEDAAAGEHLRELLTQLPWTGSADKAEPLARRLAQASRIAYDPAGAEGLRQRAERLLDKGMHAKAMPLIDEYARAPGADPARELYLRGKALYSRRDTTAAVQAFEDAARLARDPALAAWAGYHQARALWRFSSPQDAARMEELLLDSLARARKLPKGGELAESSLRLVMLSRLERARFGEALAAAAELAAMPGPSEAVEQAAWLRGVIRQAMGDHVGAAADLAVFMERFPDSDYAPAARYWTGRALDAAGQAGDQTPGQAQSHAPGHAGGQTPGLVPGQAVGQAVGGTAKAAPHYLAVLEEWPNGYYGMLAAARLTGLGLTPPVGVASAGACPDFAALSPPDAAGPALERAALLEDALLPELAERELAALNQARPTDPALALRYARLSTGLGNHVSAVRAVSRAFGGCLSRGTGEALRPVRDIVYPNRYPELVEANLAGSGVDPNVVRGLIRQESFFEPEAVSGAGAVGLMQMMPATARSQAEKYGEKGFSPASLKDPAVNVRFGVRYFLERYREYGGNLPLTLAAYNAGRVKVGVWREFLGGLDGELFVEFIPYSETRDYVKRILGNRAMYAALY